jgi:hypothetical protein
MRYLNQSLAVFLTLALLASSATAQPPAAGDDGPRGLRVRAEGAFEGYTLISPLGAGFALLLDMEGEIAHRWEADCSPGSLYLLDSGNLLFLGHRETSSRFQGPGVGGGVLQEITWEGEVVWEHVLSDDSRLMHHDVERLPSGNVLAIVWEYLPREQVIALGRDPEHVDDKGLWIDAVLELRAKPPKGADVVWEWHARDHLIQDFSPDLAGYASIPDLPGRLDINADHRDRPPLSLEEASDLEEVRKKMIALGYAVEDNEQSRDEEPRRGHAPDWLHTNAIDYHPELDLILLSTPHLGEVFVIDHSTTTREAASSSGGRWGHGGELLFRWGNPRNYGAGGPGDQRLFYQHDPTWIPGEKEGELRLLLFNNGWGRPEGGFSSVEELLLPFDPGKGFLREDGKAFGPEGPAWSYSAQGEFFSPFISGAQRLEDGNTLICSGVPGRVFEVTREGQIVWDYLNPHEGERIKIPNPPPPTALFRATRIPVDHPGLGKLGRR